MEWIVIVENFVLLLQIADSSNSFIWVFLKFQLISIIWKFCLIFLPNWKKTKCMDPKWSAIQLFTRLINICLSNLTIHPHFLHCWLMFVLRCNWGIQFGDPIIHLWKKFTAHPSLCNEMQVHRFFSSYIFRNK